LTTCLRSSDMNAIGDAYKFTMKRWRAWICRQMIRSSFNS